MGNMVSEYYSEYLKKCTNDFKDLEILRINLLNKIKLEIIKHSIIFLFLITFTIGCCYILDLNDLHNKEILSPAASIILVILLALLFLGIIFHLSYLINMKKNINSINKDFKNQIKAKFLPILLNSLKFINIPKQKILLNLDELKKSELFETIQSDQLTVDDSFTGIYEDLKFEVQECEILGGKNTSFFKGIVIAIESNKTIKNTTILSSKNDIYTGRNSLALTILTFIIIFTVLIAYLVLELMSPDTTAQEFTYIGLGFICILFAFIKTVFNILNPGNKEKFEKLILEDVTSNKRFNAYSSDQIEGRYLLTTSFIDRFNNLRTAFGTNKIKCSFCNDKLYIAIATKKDLFEFGNIFTNIKNQTGIHDFYNEITAIYKIIDYLKLSNKTGL